MEDQRLKVIISSDQEELKDLRAALAKAIEIMGHLPIHFENIGAANESAEDVSLDAVKTCDFYVGVFDANYSQATVKEYRLASELGKRVRIYIRKRPMKERMPELKAFLEEIKDKHKYDEFENVVDLAEKVRMTVALAMAKELREWPIRVRESLSRISAEASKFLGGSRLQRESSDGRLSLKVNGALKLTRRIVVALEGGWDAGVREGMVLSLHMIEDGKVRLLGRIRAMQIGDGLGPILCEVVDRTSSPDFWTGLDVSLKEGSLTPFEFDHYLTISDPEQYVNPELHLHLYIDERRKELRI